MNDFGQFVAIRCHTLGMERRKLARLCGISDKHLMRLITDAKEKPDPAVLERMAQAINVPVAQVEWWAASVWEPERVKRRVVA